MWPIALYFDYTRVLLAEFRFTIFGLGFGAGCYFEKSLSEIHHNDETTRLNNLIIDNREKSEKEIYDLRDKIYSLQEELIIEKSLRHEK